MPIKKLLVVSLIVIFALMGIPAALSVVPHTHEHDFDHSKHSTCPVYQLSQVGFIALVVVVFFIFIGILLRKFFVEFIPSIDSLSLQSFSLRGPPSFLA